MLNILLYLAKVPPSLLGAVIGGVLTLLGSLLVNTYQNHRQNRNLRQALRAEVLETKGVLEPLVAINQLVVNDEITLDEFEVIDEQYIQEDKHETAYFLFISAVSHAQKGSFNQIYESNADKIGHLSLAQSQLIVQFYSNARSIYGQIDNEDILKAAQGYFLEEESEPGEFEEERKQITKVLMEVDGTYELHNRTLRYLNFGTLDSLLIQLVGHTVEFRLPWKSREN